MEGEKKPARRWPLWSAVVLIAVFVVYPLSFGPALWISGWLRIAWVDNAVDVFYRPIWLIAVQLPDWANEWYTGYFMWWMNHIP